MNINLVSFATLCLKAGHANTGWALLALHLKTMGKADAEMQGSCSQSKQVSVTHWVPPRSPDSDL